MELDGGDETEVTRSQSRSDGFRASASTSDVSVEACVADDAAAVCALNMNSASPQLGRPAEVGGGADALRSAPRNRTQCGESHGGGGVRSEPLSRALPARPGEGMGGGGVDASVVANTPCEGDECKAQTGEKTFCGPKTGPHGVSATISDDEITEAWTPALMPFPPFLAALWTGQLQHQQASIGEGLLPLPLLNPSSFCFLSASLQALASLTPLLDLLHALAYLKLLRECLPNCLMLPSSASLYPDAEADTKHYSPAGSRKDGTTVGCDGTYARLAVKPSSDRPDDGRPVCQETYTLPPGPGKLPHLLLTCLMTLNRGLSMPSVSGLLLASRDWSPCEAQGKSRGNLDQLQRCGEVGGGVAFPVECASTAGHHDNGGERQNIDSNRADLYVVLEEGRRLVVTEKAPISVFDFLWRLARMAASRTEAQRPDAPDASPERVEKLPSQGTQRIPPCAWRCAAGQVLEAVRGAARLSSGILEQERRRIVRDHRGQNSARQHGMAPAVYRQLSNAMRHLFPGDVPHLGLAGNRDLFIREQDAHEFLQALLEELDDDCHAAEQLCVGLSVGLESTISDSIPHTKCSRTSRQKEGQNLSVYLQESTARDDCGESVNPAKAAPSAELIEKFGPVKQQFEAAPGLTDSVVERPQDDEQSPAGAGSNLRGRSTPHKQSKPMQGQVPASRRAPVPHLRDVFSGTLAEFTCCLVCGYRTPQRLLPFSCLQLSLETTRKFGFWSGPASVEDLVRASFRPQRVDHVECLYCSALVTFRSLQLQLQKDAVLSIVPHCSPGCVVQREDLVDPEAVCGTRGARAPASGVRPPRGLGQRTSGVSGSEEREEPFLHDGAASAYGTFVPPSVWPRFSEHAVPTSLIPSFFSPIWMLPASMVRAHVKRRVTLWQLFNLVSSQQKKEPEAGRGDPTTAADATPRSGNMEKEPLRAPVRHPANAGDWEATLEALKLRAGELWTTVRRSKEKIQRVQRLPQVLIIQVNALATTPYGRIYKLAERCSFPLAFDAFVLFGPAAENARDSSASSFAGNGIDELPHRMTQDTRMFEVHESCPTWVHSTAKIRGFQEATSPSSSGRRATSTGPKRSQPESGADGRLYELRAVVTHLGSSASTGHFVCYRRWDACAFGPGPGARSLLQSFCANVGEDISFEGFDCDSKTRISTPSGCNNGSGTESPSAEVTTAFSAGGDCTATSTGPGDSLIAGQRQGHAANVGSAADTGRRRHVANSASTHSASGAGGGGEVLDNLDMPPETEEATQDEGCRQYREHGCSDEREAHEAHQTWRAGRLSTWLRQSRFLGAANAAFVRVSDSSVEAVKVEDVMTTEPYLLFYQVAPPAIF
ncbi:ubiquitin carboxyl-terminal hydrolase [Besnoitia besnoiti]|uniref:ubiquitinyl hydrolase 1 n=1 Tax=Besnoitia besnoiti TaxID=94643 RepID=A0A2A9M9A3_BESBE|nr:ubiquitin carboxyl-terminal hydrolase [Besnoitia besnoiti]PFH32197.1 ubiquitin carboxyl-terminal hydrolase [Besnoitia besnoiti]